MHLLSSQWWNAALTVVCLGNRAVWLSSLMTPLKQPFEPSTTSEYTVHISAMNKWSPSEFAPSKTSCSSFSRACKKHKLTSFASLQNLLLNIFPQSCTLNSLCGWILMNAMPYMLASRSPKKWDKLREKRVEKKKKKKRRPRKPGNEESTVTFFEILPRLPFAQQK